MDSPDGKQIELYKSIFGNPDAFAMLDARTQQMLLEELQKLVAARTRDKVRPWTTMARNKQLPPEDPRHHESWTNKLTGLTYRCGCTGVDDQYSIHLFLAGRGFGKTVTGANWLVDQAIRHPNSEWAVVAPSFRDVRKTCIESDVGIRAALLPGEEANYRRNELQIILANGSVIYGYSAENPDKIRGANLWGAWCVAKGERVATLRGDVPIEQVRPGDQVMTRVGWRLVTAARRTKRNAEVMRIVTSDGGLRCTPDHRVWVTGKGWIQAQDVAPGDKMFAWSYSSLWARQPGSNGTAPATAGRVSAVTTTATTSIRRASSCTTPSGPEPADSLYPLAVTSITATSIPPITSLAISNSWMSPSTEACTPGFRAHGARHLTSERRPAGQPASDGRTRSLSVTSARAAGSSSCPVPPMSATTTRRVLRETAVVSVSRNSGCSDVYDLTVAGAHEFFAGGLLVHNCDELASWRYPATWYEGLLPALRKGKHPRIVVTTTPRPTKLINDLCSRSDGSVHITRGSTWENSANLSSIALAELRRRYEGTRLGRQELEGELLEDVEGALWNRSMLEEGRLASRDLVPDLLRVVVAVDPAQGSEEDNDETGIVVAGEGKDGHGYILDDLSGRYTPMQAMRMAIRAYMDYEADCIVAEVNSGGDYVGTALHNVDPDVPYKQIRASRGKAMRAQPVATLYEKGIMHHVGVFPDLEDQMCIAAGVPVLCRHGSVPVEHVEIGDEVLTRSGWRRVLACGRTGHRSVITLTTASGDAVTCTPDHPVWVTGGQGWTDAGEVHTGDILCVCPESSVPTSSSRVRSTFWRITGTTGLPARVDGNFYTAKYGQPLTALSPRVGKSITATDVTTTGRNPLKPAQGQSMSSGTLLAESPQGLPNRLPQPCAYHGQSASLAGSSVSAAASPSPARDSAPCSAHGSAVVSITAESAATDVYDLTVEGEHEFFAGGILVHNCLWVPESLESPDRLDALVWAVSELRGLGMGDWSAVYGTYTCRKCDRTFLLKDRTRCIGCGAEIPEEDRNRNAA